MEISVFGMGYVGAVCAACWARDGHHVIGVDVNTNKVDLINSGQSPIVENGLAETIHQAVQQERLWATIDPIKAVKLSSISVICVGTPSRDNGSLELDYVHTVCEQIGAALKHKDDFHVVVVRSTVLPGTVNSVVIPALEANSGKRAGEDFGVVINPEFLRESTALADFYSPPKTVIGSSDERSAAIIAELYAALDAPLIRLDIPTAEMIKYADNAWHATKVVFANEIGNICKQIGIDGHKVMDVFCQDTKLNISPYYLRPGFAFGGSCLPKDVRAICHKANSLDLKTPLLDSLLPSNEYQVQRALKLIQDNNSKKVGLLGLSFKAGTDDLRESPMVELVERLLGKGYQIKIYDRNVALAKLNGANKDYLNFKIPHISDLLAADIKEVVEASDTVVVGNHGDEFAAAVDTLREDQMLIDLVRVSPEVSNRHYQGICW